MKKVDSASRVMYASAYERAQAGTESIHAKWGKLAVISLSRSAVMLGRGARIRTRFGGLAGALLAGVAVLGVAATVAYAAGPRLDLRSVDDAAFPAMRATLGASERGCEPLVLDRTALTVLEDGRPVAGVSLQRGVDQTVAVETLLLLDGGAQAASAGAQPLASTAAAAIIDGMARNASASVLSFSDRLQLLHPASADKTALKTALATQPAEGPSQLIDALDQTAVFLDALEPACRVVVVFTNGVDSASRTNLAALADRLRTVGGTLLVVGVGADARRDVLDPLGQTPGVTVLYSNDPAQVRAAYLAAADRLRTVYTVVYRSQLAGDDAPHRLAVRLNSNPQAQSERPFVARSAPLEIAVSGVPEDRVVEGPVTFEVSPATGAVTQAMLLVDGQVRMTAATAPFVLTWDSAAEPPGAHLVTIRAEGASGRSAEKSYLFETPVLRAGAVSTLWPSLLSLFTVSSTSVLVGFGVLRDRRVRRMSGVAVIIVAAVHDPDVTQEITQPLMELGSGGYAGTPPARLVREYANGREEALELTGDEIVIGREPSNAVVLADGQASRRHARLWAEDGGYWIEDLQSMNGTLVNGVAIIRQALASGDAIQIGSVQFVFRIAGLETATTGPVTALV